MSDYTHINTYGDTLGFKQSLGAPDEMLLSVQVGSAYRGMHIPKAHVPTVAAELLKAAGQEIVIVPKAYEEVRTVEGLRIDEEAALHCGSGPEEAWATASQNPNWLYNKAANYIALAEYIENKDQREAEVAKKLQERRDAIALELSETGHTYDTAPPMTRRAIDRIIELEDRK